MSEKRRPLVAGNWKMNGLAGEAISLASKVADFTGDYEGVDVVIAPVATVLPSVAAVVKGHRLGVAAQNIHYAKGGAFTGELSCEMVQEVGCTWVILGHSERRQYFGETDEGVNRKVHAALESGLKPIVCVGESLEDRKGEWTKAKVSLQVRGAFSGVSGEDALKVTVAYEPIWAIGTGETASPEQAQEVHATIREVLGELYDAATSEQIRVLYGGSVKKGNIDELIQQKDIDGALVGGASLDAGHFEAIVSICNEKG